MKNKYYTPSIEEFHVGFEYEWNNPDESDEWHVAVADLEGCYHCVRDIQQGLEYNQYRVKYLDKEDIESLGFIVSLERNENHIYFTHPEWPECKILGLRLYDEVPDIHIGYSQNRVDTCFMGYIKNKSEFKKVIEQTNLYGKL